MTIFVQSHQTLYWTGILILALVCCVSWYYFGATRSMPAFASAGNLPPALIIYWRFKPFMHSLTFHLWNLVLVARLESSETRIAAGLEFNMR